MSVFTHVSEDELTAWLNQYDLGTLLELKGIASGIENTNYFVTTTQGEICLNFIRKTDKKRATLLSRLDAAFISAYDSLSNTYSYC